MNTPVTPNQHSITLGLQADKTPATYAQLATLAEQCGFDGISVFNDLGYQPALFPLLVMAEHTTRLRLGAACHNPYLLHPFEIAAQIAALDIASSGRAYLGLTRGSWLDRVGVSQTRPLRTLEESIEVIRYVLRGDRRGYDGEVHRIAPGTGLEFTPTRTRTDLLLGVWGPRGAQLAARHADEVKLGGCANPDMVAVMRRWLTDGAVAVGRAADAVGVVAGAVTVVDDDAEEARSRARREVAMYLPVVARLDVTVDVPDDLVARIDGLVATGRHREAGALLPDRLLDRFCLAGTPTDIADKALELFAAGARRIEFGTPHGLTDERGVELLGAKVLPVLRRHLTTP